MVQVFFLESFILNIVGRGPGSEYRLVIDWSRSWTSRTWIHFESIFAGIPLSVFCLDLKVLGHYEKPSAVIPQLQSANR